MIKEANKINLGFPELSILSKLHRDAEEWIDRATIAIRSKISFNELDQLVQKGEKMPVDLSELLGKLRTRHNQACEWIEKLKGVIPSPFICMSSSMNDLDPCNKSVLFKKMCETLQNDNEHLINNLIDLAAQGSRIPVEISFIQLLHIAIDGRNWSLKAKRWIPNIPGEPSRRGKIEDLRDHLLLAESIRNKAKQIINGATDWIFEFEENLLFNVKAVDSWIEKVRIFSRLL